jgi:SAM-dependent methyltransferase
LFSEVLGAPARVPDDWYVGFHTGLAARFWRAAGATMADEDALLVRGLLGPPPATVLDAPCGDGRLTIRLAAAGYAAIGVDLAAAEIDHARAAARGAGVEARFETGDLRALPEVGQVDAERSLAAMRRALRPGGRLVLESLTAAESLLVAGVQPRAEYEYGGVRMTTTNHYRAAESRLESEVVFEDAEGHREHARMGHRVHTSGEIVRLLQAAGFSRVELLGADGASAYELGSPRLIAVGRA